MIVTKYEIDMLDVKSADAFLIHFWDDKTNYEFVVLIDGGNYQDGATIAKFIRTYYGTNIGIDLAICSHCDKDHFGGITYLLEQQRDNGKDNMNIDQIWINDPGGEHVLNRDVKWSQNMSRVTKNVKARSVYDLDGHDNLLDIIQSLQQQKKISSWFEPFSDSCMPGQISEYADGLFKIISPTVYYYESLVPDLRNELQRKKDEYDSDESEEQIATLGNGSVYSKTLDDAEDDPSSNNRSSVIVLFQPSNGKKYLFMGDACRDSINHIPQDLFNSIKKVHWLKVPHHGSKHNLNSYIINHLHPKVAFISTEKYGHYLSKAVVNALNKLGARVYSTHFNGNMCHHKNTLAHKGYSTANPIK